MRYSFICILCILCIMMPIIASANTVQVIEEGWYTVVLLPDDNTLNVEVYRDENNKTEIAGADILIFNFLPVIVNDIYITTDTYTYMCSITRETGIIYNNYTFHIQYSDIYGNSYDNYTSDKSFFYSSGVLEYELGIDRTGLYIEKPLLYFIKDYIYTYEEPLEVGWLNCNITSNLDSTYSLGSLTVKYRVVKLDEYDSKGVVFNSIKSFVDDYVPFGSEFILLLTGFSAILKYALFLLVRFITYPLYIVLLILIIIMGHSLVQGSFMKILSTFVYDWYLVLSVIIGFFKSIIMFIIDLVKMVKPFG